MRENPQSASIPVVLLSAKGQTDEIARGLRSGAARYLVKPFESQALRTCVEEVLQEHAGSQVKE
jgi:DNA-binding response OmpR family regulator